MNLLFLMGNPLSPSVLLSLLLFKIKLSIILGYIFLIEPFSFSLVYVNTLTNTIFQITNHGNARKPENGFFRFDGQ